MVADPWATSAAGRAGLVGVSIFSGVEKTYWNPPLRKGVAMSTTKTRHHRLNRRQPKEVDAEKKYETVVTSGQHALRALLTINGGAIIAFLTFIGHLWDRNNLPPAGSVLIIVAALKLLVFGTFLTVLAYGTIFLTNVLSRLEQPNGPTGCSV